MELLLNHQSPFQKVAYILKGLFYFFFYCFRILGFNLLKSLNHFWSILCKMKIIYLVFLFYRLISSFPSTICWKGCLLLMDIFWKLCQNEGAIAVWVCFWVFYYILLIYLPVPRCFYGSDVMILTPLPFLLRITFVICWSFGLM